MRYSFYPGCTLKTKAKRFEDTALKSAAALGIDLQELEEWQCCGAVFPLASDELVTLLSPVRALNAAAEKGQPLVTLCSACHHVLKRANEVIRSKNDVREKVTDYLEIDYDGSGKVIHFLELLRDEIGFDTLAEKVKEKLEGRKLAAYYGCLLLRPQEAMQFDDPEDPQIIEDFLVALGADVIEYPYRTECCGAYLSVTEKELAEDRVGRIISSAKKNGVEGLVVACPLCHYNLEQFQNDNPEQAIPIYYFTELLAEALGLSLKEKTA
ncbi:MAG: CoB--CoM heterodisulfide reductase iron-sulfur subunit B family protein [Dethiobacteria bacterium]|nr:disulfide reductase [Bacillota bacterium]